MSTYTIPGPAVSGNVYVIRSATLTSETLRSKNRSDGHRVRVGMRDGEYASWWGTWDQGDNDLSAGTPRELLEPSIKGRRIKDKQQIVVEIQRTGSPASISDCEVTVVLEVRGGTSASDGPILTGAASVDDPATRDVLSSTRAQLNRSGIFERRISIPLRDSSPGAITSESQTYDESSDTGSLTVSTLNTYTSFSPVISITLAPPVPGQAYRAIIHGRAYLELTTGACAGSVRIQNTTDGTTLDSLTSLGTAGQTAFSHPVFGSEEITESKTYELQFRRDTGSANNAVWQQPKLIGTLSRSSLLVVA